jgi:hypothetical protein
MDGVWCFRRLLYRFFGVMRSVVASCGVSSPFYSSPFFPLEGAPVTSLGQGSSPLTDHFCSSQDRSFPLFSRQKLLSAILLLLFMFLPYVCMILAYFSRLLSSAISSLFLGKARKLIEFIEEHDCIICLELNALFYRGRKLFHGLRAHTWLQESSFGDRGISQTNPSVFS